MCAPSIAGVLFFSREGKPHINAHRDYILATGANAPESHRECPCDVERAGVFQKPSLALLFIFILELNPCHETLKGFQKLVLSGFLG